jgi:hypothetical protein
MNKSFLIITLLFFTNNIFAQKSMLFFNTKLLKTIEVAEGNTISIQYKGYNNQIFHTKNIVTEINDSSIVLGHISSDLPIWIQKLSKKFEPNFRIILIKDIVAFRKMSNGRLIGKNLLSTSLTVGVFVATYDLFKNGGLSPLQSIFVSIGIGFGNTLVNAFVLPENPINKISDNWVITVKN